MNALLLMLGQSLILAATLGAVLAATVCAFGFAGRALNPARTALVRVKAGVQAALCALAILGSAAAGFWGAGALLYMSAR